MIPLGLCRPIEGGVGIGKVRSGTCDRPSIQPVERRERAPNANALEALVVVAGVGDRREAGALANLLELAPAPGETERGRIPARPLTPEPRARRISKVSA